MWFLVLALLLHYAQAVPYEVTEYYEVVTLTENDGLTLDFTNDPFLKTSTQYITPTGTAIPSPLTAQTTTDTLEDVTYVNIHLPTGAGDPVSSQEENMRQIAVPITYSQCTTSVSGTEYALPDTTTHASIFLPPDVAAAMSTITVYPSDIYNSFIPDSTPYPVALVDPAGIDPTDFASLSHHNQARNCLTATASVDYRHACDVRPAFGKGGSGCGDLNPCCFDCDAYTYLHYCIGNCARNSNNYHMRCANGLGYYSGTATPLDANYTRAPPTRTWDPNSPPTSSGAAVSMRAGMWISEYPTLYIFLLLGFVL
ncbi:hypothetical protein PHISCL_07164 [Aspergillus sclerotialis]|uniref:Uncharacterized protein n=1 Tax=Aspergillus sclerotialis TaxID=2070753 RepID=A0A3A2ZMA3_9EURO|nr:hypothetical protein PHISCL_07164 [Aspergillus sclerotialis]